MKVKRIKMWTFEEVISHIPAKPYYNRDEIVIYLGDNQEILSKIPHESIDLVVTSPPYDNLREYGGHQWNFEIIADQLRAKLVKGGIIVWVVGDATEDGTESGNSFKQALFFKKIGLNLYDTMIYAKNGVPINARRYEQNFEYMFVLSKGNPNTFNPIMRDKIWEDNRKQKAAKRNKDGSFGIGYASPNEECTIGNIWYYDVGGGHVTDFKPAYQHPAIFPEELAQDHI